MIYAGSFGASHWIIVLLVIAFLVFLIKGMIKTFKRNALVAILCVIFLFPIWLIWSFVELFTGEIKPKVIHVKQVGE